jgi:nucleoside-diphosphate-sugar epimerase
LGTLDDAETLAQAAQAADIVVNAASADHKGAVVALLDALAGSGKPFIHTSGSSIVGTRAKGERSDAVFDEDTPITPSPARAARVALERVHSLLPRQGLPPCHRLPEPDLRPRPGANPDSVQVPLLIRLAKEARQRGACRTRREHLVERAYRRPRDALRACDRQGRRQQLLLFAEERREFDARSPCRGDQPHAGFCGTARPAMFEWTGSRPPNGAERQRRGLDGIQQPVRAKARALLGWEAERAPRLIRRDRAGVLPGSKSSSSAKGGAIRGLSASIELLDDLG